MESKGNWIGHAACFCAYLIFAINVIVCKDLTNSHIISPMGLFCLRALGASVLFWIISLFLPKEKVDPRDFWKIFIASMLGLVMTQVSFLFAITMTTPLDTSLYSSITPIFTMFIAAIALKEPITWKKLLGVVVSFAGIIFLILNSVSARAGAATTRTLGIVLCLLNNLSFALYLGIFRPLISKYSVVTFMKWMFLFAMVVALPFTAKELVSLDYGSMPTTYWTELLFIIIFSTFIAYYLIPFGQKRVRPTIISIYSYIQPIVASVVSIWVGMDVLSWQKVVAALSIFVGLYIVNRSPGGSGVEVSS